ADETTILPLTIAANVSDDKGIKNTPLFYFSTTPPVVSNSAPDLTGMTQLSTLLISGNSQNGQYAADVPNPVANMPAGTSMTLYSVFAADDDDDAMGTCDHHTVSPVFQMKVTASGHGDLAPCAACDHDVQCSAGAECVHLGSQGASVCLEACAGGCPTG